MRMIRTALLLAGLAWAALAPDGARADVRAAPPAPILSAATGAVGEAFAAMERGDWAAVDAFAGAVSDPLAVKLLFWLETIRDDAPVNFFALDAFITANPTWPQRTLLIRRAEEALPADMPPLAVVAWFKGRDAETPYGGYRLAAALLALGKRAQAIAIARLAWHQDEFTPELEAAFRFDFGPLLRPADHLARLDALLWSGRFTAARRLYDLIGADWRALAEARIRLRLRQGDVDAAVAAVPPALVDNPGLIYERVRWRRKNGLEEEARSLLAGVRGDLGRPDLWWIERSTLARDALRLGHVSEAYRLVRDHALSEPGDYAEAEWLAGWIALRFLREPETARTHFRNMFKVVRFPISVARAAYWSARASEAAGDRETARDWDRRAASHPGTFYGRLAAQRDLGDTSLILPPDPQPSAQDQEAFAGHELVRAIRLLAAHNQVNACRTFLRALAEVSPAPGWQTLTATLAAEAGGPSLGVQTAKRAMRNGYSLFAHAYPIMPLPDLADGSPYPVDPALVLAMIRQESEFDLAAVSSSGARGLMQLMPGTARYVAASLDVPYSAVRLIADGGYNVKLGQAYLSRLLDTFGGSYVLAFAAYNAGPARVRQWLEAYGDPRAGDVDMVDWIEMLPFEETRNYVQRAIENMWVYQARLGSTNQLLATDSER
jgi:soluble lytic murein transglycosylase